jgi:hypothetical protein
MKSRKARKREARYVIAGGIGVVAILLFFSAMIESISWRAVGGLTVVFSSFSYLTWREARPRLYHWLYLSTHPGGNFQYWLYQHPWWGRPFIRLFVRFSTRDPLEAGMRGADPSEPLVPWYMILAFGATALGTFLQIIAAWP